MVTRRSWRYVDAIRNMRARQLAYRVRRAVPMPILASGIRDEPPPGWRPLASTIGVEPAPSAGPQEPPHLDAVFRAYAVEREARDRALWEDERDGLLFLFHLHGFQDMARYASSGPEPRGKSFWEWVVRDWLARCERPAMPAWHPYPTSGRVVAWCAALSSGPWLDDLREPMLRSLWRQLRVLRRSVEHDIGGNHVLRNAAALVIGGTCLEDSGYHEQGLRLLQAELDHQILDDGGHEERSPSYHRLVLADLRDVAAVLDRAGTGAPEWLTHTAARMEAWLGALAGPDGDVPPLNDGWDGPPIDIPQGRPALQRLDTSGYIVLREAAAQTVLDVGPLSPAHLPAHAHADALSLVLWADGAPLLIDPGSGAYAGADRDHFRGTAAHNTVEVDGTNQCDLWGTFRAAGLPRVHLDAVDRHGEDVIVVRAHHDGYRRLADPVVHERTFLWLGTDGVAVIDRLRCREVHKAISRLHFAEGIEKPMESEHPGGLRFSVIGEPDCREYVGRRSPFIGETTPISIIELCTQLRSDERFGWQLVRPGVEIRLLDSTVHVDRPGRDPLRIDLS